ncbi:protein kinase domain-containing protein, partial [Haematococcus lacustris]
SSSPGDTRGFGTAAQQQQRAILEAAVCKSLGHPNVVATYHHNIKQAGPKEGEAAADAGWALSLVQELCSATLQDALRLSMLHAQDSAQQPIMELVLSLLTDVARGMAYIHGKGIIHGDLTPGNVLLKQEASCPAGVAAKVSGKWRPTAQLTAST